MPSDHYLPKNLHPHMVNTLDIFPYIFLFTPLVFCGDGGCWPQMMLSLLFYVIEMTCHTDQYTGAIVCIHVQILSHMFYKGHTTAKVLQRGSRSLLGSNVIPLPKFSNEGHRAHWVQRSYHCQSPLMRGTESTGSRWICHAAEVTPSPSLRRQWVCWVQT